MHTADELVLQYASQIQGKVVLTTGVSPGSLGAYFVQAIAKGGPAWIILAGRDPEKAKQAEDAIRVSNPSVKTRFLLLDLESLQSVREAATAVDAWFDIPRIDVLVNNAGMTSQEYHATVDGFERQLAANYLGHFLFTNLLMKKLLASSSPRIVNLASSGHRMGPFRFGDYNFGNGKEYSSLRAYGQAKTANMLFSISLAEKFGHRGLLSFSIHPGLIMTNGVADLDLKARIEELGAINRYLGNKEGFDDSIPELLSIEQGAATHVYAAFDPEIAAHNGKYLIDCRVADPLADPVSPWANSPFEAEKLWRLSERLVGQMVLFLRK